MSAASTRRPLWARMLIVLGVAVIAAGAAAVGFEMSKERLPVHVNPVDVTPPSTPNWALAAPATTASLQHATLSAPHVQAEPLALIEALDAVALGEPRTERIDDGADPLWRSYRQRSALFGFPDLISVRAVSTEQGASLHVFSRSVYGYSDLGVNGKRVSRWLDAAAARF